MKKISLILFVFTTLLITCKKAPELKVYNLEIEEKTVELTAYSATVTMKYHYPTKLEYVNAYLSASTYFENSTVVHADINDSVFVLSFVDLQNATKYYYKIEYSNGVNIVNLDIRSFTTDENSITAPTVTTKTIAEITSATAKCGGKVTSDGGSAVTMRGVCWSEYQEPTTDDPHTTDGTGTGDFTSLVTGLTGFTKYYIRAYATNDFGTAYGEEFEFTTLAGIPTVTTNSVTSITATSAMCSGEIISDGGDDVLARGVCWSTNQNPTIDDNHTADGTGIGYFVSSITGLENNTTYYVRAYATNSIGTSYGEERNFETHAGLAIITTSEITNITSTSALSGGNIINDGGFNITARGVCWSTSQNPTISDSHTTDGNGTGAFTSNMNNLDDNTVYYVRAYATNSEGTSYGEQKTFKTLEEINAPTVTTRYVSDITAYSAISGGTVTNDGGLDVTARGVCWSTNENPTINDLHTNDGTGLGTFTSEITSLSDNTTYYVRAYATNGNGTSYGEQRTFATLQGAVLPTVTTRPVNDITSNSATCGGNVTSDGGSDVTARGVCWSTLQNPTIDDSHTNDGTGTGSFFSNLTGLDDNTVYYVRAYATNEAGTAYGDEKTFSTEQGQTWTNGVLPGVFSISATKQVYFSQGNLQYIGSASTPYWKFANNQWEYFGDNDMKQGNDRDLFCWGTSGYNHGAVCYQPWHNGSTTNSDYWAYGMQYYSLSDSTGKADWGYNAILNGGNQENQWHTLSILEWEYLLSYRMTSSGKRFAKGRINDINGIILLPDGWINNYYSINEVNNSSASFESNVLDATTWIDYFEIHGAVFLPAAGASGGNTVGNINTYGCYYSTSLKSDGVAGFEFFDSGIVLSIYYQRFSGRSVRLVKDVE